MEIFVLNDRVLNQVNRNMNFKLFLEAQKEDIARIQDAMDKVSERPFNELFGKKNRFLVKVYNPKFEQAARYHDMDPAKFDMATRKYGDKHIYTVIKSKLEAFRKKIEEADVPQQVEELRDDFKKRIKKGEVHFPNKIKHADVFDHAHFEYWSDWGYQLKNRDRRDLLLLDLDGIEFVRKEFKADTVLSEEQIEKLFTYILDGKIPIENIRDHHWGVIGGFIDNVKHIINEPAKELKKQYAEPIKQLKRLKQSIDQDDIFYWLLFSRHPIDVLRMSDHKKIYSCHRLNGGTHRECAFTDAQNNGGVVYMVAGGPGRRLKDKLDDPEIFYDGDRDIPGVRPIGRTRLRRFIDTKTGEDFAVLARYTDEQNYGFFTREVWEEALKYIQEHQEIFNNPPEEDYAYENIVMAGAEYTDNTPLIALLNTFFGKRIYSSEKIKFATGREEKDFESEMHDIVDRWDARLHVQEAEARYEIVNGDEIEFEITWTAAIDMDQIIGQDDDRTDQMIIRTLKNNRSYIQDHIIKDCSANREAVEQLLTAGITSVDFSVNGNSTELLIHITYQNDVTDPEPFSRTLDTFFLYKVFNVARESAIKYTKEIINRVD